MADADSLPNGPLKPVSRSSLIAAGIAGLAVISGVLTYAVVTGLIAYPTTPDLVIGLLLANVGLVLALAALIAWRVIRLWAERRRGQAGARLHVRMVAMFAAVAVVPAIFVAIFAAVTLNLGVEAWFSARVKSALENAVNVAERYVQGHERLIVADAYEIANSIEHDPQLFDEQNHARAEVLFTRLAELTRERGLQASYIIDSKQHVLGSTKQRFLPDLKLPSEADIQAAAKGAIVIDANSNVGVVRALIRMQALNDAYLLVVRSVDPKVLGYYQRTVDAASEYRRLDQNRAEVQLVFAALFGVISLLVLLAAIWLGLWASNRLVRPISRLIGAAERVSEGDLKAQVPVERGDDEIGSLGLAFNRMTQQLDAQRNELIEASHQIDMRRRFTEAVLAGVSAGVVGLDANGRITIVNRAAARLLHVDPDEIEGRHYAEAVPELGSLIKRAIEEPVGHASGEAIVKRGGTARSLSVQVASETGASGYVITFDDITDLVSAQRTAAWADVARRIAHEIKNPLTPIQLSAERLKRKYGKEVSTDPEVFDQCTDTIIRQVGDIGRMVDEFSSFARMPAPVMRRENMQELLQQAIFLQRVANPQIAFETKAPKDTVYFECDGRLVSQAFTNVLKNAVEAIGARVAAGDDAPGHITSKMELTGDKLVVSVADNGVGLPHEHRHRLTEPYVTTRAKGTGLGLAIVRKILEDHGGEVVLEDRDGGGAEIKLSFPVKNVRETTGRDNEQERIAHLA
ncbi:MAG TPA: PAS domain-containing sensor histidine kinase [Rhizomicrobium sp.]|nr:PAS domain-containing sensor histidine kinase [Rhizomicrobium sp.]